MTHATHVEAWLESESKDLTSAELVALFERAVGALWRRAEVPLGEITLTAIVDRVLYTAAERYAFVAAVTMDRGQIQFDDFRQKATSQTRTHLLEVVRFVLVELLTVIGNLTDEILTPALHAELSKVSHTGKVES